MFLTKLTRDFYQGQILPLPEGFIVQNQKTFLSGQRPIDKTKKVTNLRPKADIFISSLKHQ
jgi:hypothetical protein